MPKQNIPPADYPQTVLQQIALLGQHIAIARKRRGETQAQWAGRLGVSQPTMARMERGDPSVAMASYVMGMWLVNPAVAVADLIAPQNDHAALEREVTRIRGPRKTAPTAQATQVTRVTQAAPALVSGGMHAVAEPEPVFARKRVAPAASDAAATAAGLAALIQPRPSKAPR